MEEALRAAVGLASGIWAGGWVVLAFISAPVLFRSLSSRTEAGNLAGEMMRIFGAWEVVFGLVLAAGAGILWKQGDARGVERMVLVSVLLVVFIANRIALWPTMARLRHAIGSFDAPGDPAALARFRRLHGISMALALAQIALAAAVAVREAA